MVDRLSQIVRMLLSVLRSQQRIEDALFAESDQCEDQAKIDALTADLKSSNDKVAAALAAHHISQP
jgi:hypothetical protein